MVNTSAAELRAIALRQFATNGFAGSSLQHIADRAGLSKSSVLYHYASKEALLEAAVTPAIDRLQAVIASVPTSASSAGERDAFVADFIDFLLDYRLAVHTFINQGQSLRGLPVIDRANALVEQLGLRVSIDLPTTEERVRLGVALGGAAYILVASATWGDEDQPVDEIRAALVAVVSQLLGVDRALPALTA